MDTETLNLKKRVAIRRKYIAEHGSKEAGIAPGCGPQNVPEWFNPAAFEHAQQLYKTYKAQIILTQIYALIFVCLTPKTLGVIRSTGTMRTVSLGSQRIISLLIHFNNFFTSYPFDPKSKAYRSLKITRGYHRQVAVKLNQLDKKVIGQDELWINQEKMCLEVFASMGTLAIFPEKLGFGTFTEYDHHCMFHFWRVIGYCLGQSDQFNLCNGSDIETVELCKQVFTEYQHKMTKVINDNEEPVGIEMLSAFSFYLPGVLYYAVELFNVNGNPFPLRNILDKFIYRLFKCMIFMVNRSVFISSILSTITGCLMYLTVKMRKFYQWYFELIYGEIVYPIDERCPFNGQINYKTACELNVF